MPEASASVPSKPPGPSIPVIFNEAALDSPTFRATALHVSDQLDAITNWLDGYVKATSKLVTDVQSIEDSISSYLAKIVTSPGVADTVIDHDYTYLALKRVAEGSKEWWMDMIIAAKKMETTALDPIRGVLVNDLRLFRDAKRALDHTQKSYDAVLARCVSQPKTKEPSALREDAFAVFETRKAYLKASMDFCQLAPALRYTLDKLLIKVSSGLWNEMSRTKESAMGFSRWGHEMDRLRGWAREMESSEAVFRKEMMMVRKVVGDGTLQTIKPSRELDDYSTSTVPFLKGGPATTARHDHDGDMISDKQGWLFLRTLSGKPVRTSWARRWYYCRDGVFGWLVQSPQGVLQGDEIGVLLCNAKPAVAEDRRFCFEVKTGMQTLMLQTETQGELTEWLEVFDVVRQLAFEASEARGPAAGKSGMDPSFSITPPSIAEFSAKNLDAQVEDVSFKADMVGTLPVPSNLAERQSIETSAAAGQSPSSSTAPGSRARTFAALTREDGKSGRDHAARIIHKLDLHRKGGGSGETSAFASGLGAASGIASLIGASHNLLPAYPAQGANLKSAANLLPPVEQSPGSLAPNTLVKPPVPTALSRTAVIAAAERGLGTDKSKSMPAPIMANYWGSNAWGNLYAQEATPADKMDDEENPIGVVLSDSGKTGEKDAAADSHIAENFPPSYPPELKAQHGQFRILFPRVPLDEKLVLVIRAAWTTMRAGDEAETAGNGRLYVTPDSMYFYGQQMGMLSAFGVSLDSVTEVTAQAGTDCDYLFMHLRQEASNTDYSQITIRTFIEDPTLLHARLNLLIDDLQSEEPMELQEIVAALTNLQKDEDAKRSLSVGSWEEIPSNTPFDDATQARTGGGSRRILDRSPGLPLAQRPARQMATHKVQLPTVAVIYEPEDMPAAVTERHFEVSAKACFHVLFGDKSFVFPKLYFERRTQQIAQGPWTLSDHGVMKRDFTFDVNYTDILGRPAKAGVKDSQTIDLFSDHVTYAVTHTKTAWHLPHSQHFRLVTKVIITHVAKSKCKLAVYIRVDWSKTFPLSKWLVERQALDDAKGDAEELAEVATDQVRKLGPHSRTKRAIQVYGHIGQQTQVVVFSPAEPRGTKKQAVKMRTLTAMIFETVRSFMESVVTSVIMWVWAAVRKIFRVISAQRVILILLTVSLLANVFLTSKEGMSWWSEARAARFMARPRRRAKHVHVQGDIPPRTQRRNPLPHVTKLLFSRPGLAIHPGVH